MSVRTSPLRWGLLGTARINRLLIPAIRASQRSEVAAVASRERARAAAYAREWQIPHAATYAELLARSDVDVVYVPLPNSLHVEWTLRSLAAGKHVLCEKPLATSARDVDAVARAARRAGLAVAEGFMYRHHAQTARVLTLLRDGAIGELRSIHTAFTFTQDRAFDVRLDPALGGGALWDIGCYPVSLGQLLAGAPPARVSGTHQLGPTGVDEAFAGLIQYANGSVCQFFCGFRATYHTFLRIVGTSGVLHVDRPFRPSPLERLRLERGGRFEEMTVEGSPIFVDEVVDMEDAILGIRAPRLTLEESRLHVATLEALYRSARTGLTCVPDGC